jgi:polyferredoxin
MLLLMGIPTTIRNRQSYRRTPLRDTPPVKNGRGSEFGLQKNKRYFAKLVLVLVLVPVFGFLVPYSWYNPGNPSSVMEFLVNSGNYKCPGSE